MHHNPGLIARADFRGDLRASVLASLEHDAGAGQSELELARRCGGSRAQVRSALENLELTGKVRRMRTDRDRRTQISLGECSVSSR
jgi:predicted transcriptional regulator